MTFRGRQVFIGVNIVAAGPVSHRSKLSKRNASFSETSASQIRLHKRPFLNLLASKASKRSASERVSSGEDTREWQMFVI